MERWLMMAQSASVTWNSQLHGMMLLYAELHKVKLWSILSIFKIDRIRATSPSCEVQSHLSHITLL
jgi:hypothetical protein